MLGLNTRKISTYGKRTRRVVNVDDDVDISPPKPASAKPAALIPLDALSPALRRIWQQRPRALPSSPQPALVKSKARASPPRTPLADNTNVSPLRSTVKSAKRGLNKLRKSSPYASPPSRKPILRTYRSKTAGRTAHIVESGSPSSDDDEVVPASRNTKAKTKVRAVVVDSDDDDATPPARARESSTQSTNVRPQRATASLKTITSRLASSPEQPIVISDSEDDDYVPSPPSKAARTLLATARTVRGAEQLKPMRQSTSKAPQPVATSSTLRSAKEVFELSDSDEPGKPSTSKPVRQPEAPAPGVSASKPLVPFVLLTPVRRLEAKPKASHAAAPARRPFVARVATPVRAVVPAFRRKATPRRAAASPASSAAASLESLVLPDELEDIPAPVPASPLEARVPEHLQLLLHECGQSAPYAFSSFLETFPFDDVLAHVKPSELKYRKLGEASFSEVFAIGDVVLKVIPLRNEELPRPQPGTQDADEWTVPDESDAKDVLREITITREMGALCTGFTKLLKAFVVRDVYPQSLLKLWDEYKKIRGSESIRPDGFPESQAYAILILPNLGTDLEAFTFKPSAGWSQACAIFWQVAKSLCVAEEKAQFEHRDLHWGQVLVQRVSSRASARGFDSEAHGVRATIIDLGLSRMQIGRGNEAHWAPFAEEVFEGTGDYQFDVYRLMRASNKANWASFNPLTNVMWLHYLAVKLTQDKRLRKPTTAQERKSAESLLEAEIMLASSISLASGKRKLRKGSAELFKSAADVAHWAEERGWLVDV